MNDNTIIEFCFDEFDEKVSKTIDAISIVIILAFNIKDISTIVEACEALCAELDAFTDRDLLEIFKKVDAETKELVEASIEISDDFFIEKINEIVNFTTIVFRQFSEQYSNNAGSEISSFWSNFLNTLPDNED